MGQGGPETYWLSQLDLDLMDLTSLSSLVHQDMRNYKEPTGSQKKSCDKDSVMTCILNVPSVDSDAGGWGWSCHLAFPAAFLESRSGLVPGQTLGDVCGMNGWIY